MRPFKGIDRRAVLELEGATESPAPPHRWAPYAIAVVAVAAAAALSVAIENRFGSTYLFFYPAVVLAAAMGGIGPGLLATLVPAGLVLLWLAPIQGARPAIATDLAARTVFFLGMGSMVSLGFELYRRAIHRASRLERLAALRVGEVKVAERDRHLRTVLDTAQDGFWMLDGEGRLLDANPAASALTGYDRDELLGKNVAELEFGELPAVERIRRAQGQGSARFDAWLRRKDGDLRQVSVSMSATGLAGGIVVSFFRDVTRRREIELDLQRARRTLLMITRCDEAILRASGEAELLADVCRVIVDTGGYRMCWVGIAENDERRSIRPVAHAGHEEGYLSLVDAVWADAPKGRGPIGIAVREGRIVVGRDFATDPTLAPWKEEARRRGYASATAVPIAHGQEKVGVLVMYAADVSAFSEEELRLLGQLADDLGFGVHALRERVARTRADAAREAALVERDRLRDQLLQAHKLDSIGRLAGVVAHDFNNLLTVILSCGDDLRRASAEGKPPARETIDDLIGAGRHAQELTGRLLAFARRQPIAPVPLDLDAAVRKEAGLLRRAIGNPVELVEDLQADGWRVRFDPGLLGQVLMNLSVNASHAMPAGGRLVLSTRTVTLAPEATPPVPGIPAGDYVRLAVRDTGTGMSPEVQAHLFEPFFTTKPSGAGTGLGLSTVYGIVKQGGAWIGVESTPGEGSEFRIWFPRDAGA